MANFPELPAEVSIHTYEFGEVEPTAKTVDAGASSLSWSNSSFHSSSGIANQLSLLERLTVAAGAAIPEVGMLGTLGAGEATGRGTVVLDWLRGWGLDPPSPFSWSSDSQ